MLNKIVIVCIALMAIFPSIVSTTYGEEVQVIRTTPVTTTEVRQMNLIITEESVGRVEAVASPVVAAEVNGQVIRILVGAGQEVAKGNLMAELDSEAHRLTARSAQAEVDRLSVLIANQERTVQRYNSLIESENITQAKLDGAVTQLSVLKGQFEGANAQLSYANRRIRKSKIYAPINGRVEKRLVFEGDYVNVGSHLFQITNNRELRIVLPFPEGVARKLQPGLSVRLSSPIIPDLIINSVVAEIRPSVNIATRAIEVIVNIDNPGIWRVGATVDGSITVSERAGAFVVPDQSVVRRPAGEVVYVIKGDKAVQRLVETGQQIEGLTEIIKGVVNGDIVAVDGAGFLTDGTTVSIRKQQ